MRYQLHEHQSRALDMLRASLMAGKRRPMVQAPTGFGKTLLSAAIIEGALAKGKRVLFVVPFLSLIEQTVDAFAAQGIASVGVMQGYHPLTDAAQPVQVCSMQTLQRRRLPKADLVLIDEAHRWYGFLGNWMALPEWQRVPFVGLSATPWTKGLGKHYDDLIVAATTADLIEKGFLSRFKTFAPSHPDLSKVRTVAGDYHEGQLAEAMSQPVLIGDVVSTWLRLAEDRPTLVFAVDRAHAKKLTNAFEAAGVPCGYIDAMTDRAEREQIGQRLRHGQIKVVCNIGCLTTGVDWDVRAIVLARPTKSESLFVQIIGRGLRTADGKADCLILDHSNTTTNLGFVSDIHHDELDMGAHQAGKNKPKEKPTPLPKECPSCSFMKPAGIRKCSSCGFEPEMQSAIEEQEGELIQISGRRKTKAEATPHDKQTFYSMCLWYARSKGHQSGAAAHRYKDRFGVWPRGLSDRPTEPDADFVRWMHSQNIRQAKARERDRRIAKEGARHAA
ncbi:DEAD/DEAH box helicase (plasmid) [Aureimonas ureilytica]|uniref:DEAD/DEAH box helicase n=1 Tax=Aureimonas ureilytica TaxID=401562 RepID=UPI003CF2C025